LDAIPLIHCITISLSLNGMAEIDKESVSPDAYLLESDSDNFQFFQEHTGILKDEVDLKAHILQVQAEANKLGN
jgi:hypothetical protein